MRVDAGTLPAMRLLLVAIAAPAIAHADERVEKRAEPASRHLVYGEAFGKAGPYGIGYELGITPKLALGIAASYARLGDQRLTTIVPYVHVEWLHGRHHAMVSDVGLSIVHSVLPSPVPEWDGMSETGAGGEATLGWEWRPRRLVVRTSGGLAVGEGGVAPFLGLAIGARL